MNFNPYKLMFTRSYRTLAGAAFKNNAVCSQLLGLCTALAVTNKVENAVAMSLGTIFVLGVSSTTVSSLRKWIPSRYRIVVYMLIISTNVIVVDRYLKAFYPDISRALGPYVALIITNCIIMGRQEDFASKNRPWYSFLDALGSGLAYSYSLLIISLVREVLAFGTIFNVKVLPAGWVDWIVMAMAPGAFFVFALYLWGFRKVARLQIREE